MNHQLLASKLQHLTLLYIEDDLQVQGFLAEFLKRYTSQLFLAQNATEGKKLYASVHPDIILLDINLPGQSGIDFAAEIRQKDHRTRILISTAYTDKPFLLKAVELELTRYLVKPVTGEELLEALTKATTELAQIDPDYVDLDEGFVYDKARKLLLHHEETIVLRRKEMQLLEFLIACKGHTATYEMLQYEVWPDSPMTQDAVRAQIRNLRKKSHPGIVVNVSGIGYRLCEGDST